MIRRSVGCRFMLLVAVLLIAVSAGAVEPVGTFSQVQGGVDILRNGALPATAAKVGDAVQVKDMIRTKSGATAEVTFRDGNILKIAQRSRVDIATYLDGAGAGERSLSLPRGKVQAVVGKGVKPGSPPQKFEIRTPNAVAGVRGTDYFVFHERNLTGVLVKSGEVYTYNPQASSQVVTVPAGTATTVAAKSIPATPRPTTTAEMQGHEREMSSAGPQKSNKGGGSASSSAESGKSSGTNGSSSGEASGTASSSVGNSGTTVAADGPASSATTTSETGAETISQSSPAPAEASSTNALPTPSTASQPAPSASPTAQTTSMTALSMPTTGSILDSITTIVPVTTATSMTPIVTEIATTPPPITETNTQIITSPPISETNTQIITSPPVFKIDSTPSTLTNQTNAVFFFSDPTLTYRYKLDGGTTQSWSSAITGLADGNHTIEFIGIDPGGNSSSPVSYTWTVDTVAPTTTLVAPASAVSTTVPTFFTVQSSEEGSTEYRLDGGVWQSFGGTISSLAAGVHILEFRTLDLAQNSSSPVGTALFAGAQGFVAEVNVGPIWRDTTFTNNLLTVRPLLQEAQNSMRGLLGGPSGLWANSSTPFTLRGVSNYVGAKNDYWFGSIGAKNYATNGITTYDGGTFSGFAGGANVYSINQGSMNLAAIYISPANEAGLLFGSGNGALGSGYLGASGSLNQVPLNLALGVTPTAIDQDTTWWATNTVTSPPMVVVGMPPGNNPSGNNAEGFLVDASLNLVGKFSNRGDVVRFTTFKPDSMFGVWQRESWGSFSGSSSQAVLITNLAQGATNQFGYITPDHAASIISLGSWGANGELSGTAYGYWGDWTAGRARLLAGALSGSYNSDIGTFGGVTTGTWLDVQKYLNLNAGDRQLLGFPVAEETSSTFTLSGSNSNGTTVDPFAVRIFSNSATDKIKLWASTNITGSYTTTQLQGEQIAITAGNDIRGTLRIEHAGASPSNGDVWLAEIRGMGQQVSGGFSGNFEGIAVGIYDSSAGPGPRSFSGTAAGTTHPLTYASNFMSATNLLKRYDGAAGYQSAGSLFGIFGGMSLWGATDQSPSDFEVIGVRSPATPLASQDYIFTSNLDSYNSTAGTMTTLDGGAYKGYFAGALANGASASEEPLTGRVAALYAAPDGSTGILTGKLSGYLDMNGIWEGHGTWFPVALISAPGTVNPASMAATDISELSLPLNVAQTGNFQAGGSIASAASIFGNNLDRNWITAYPNWGTFRLITAGSFSGATSNQWAQSLTANNGSYFVDGAIIGDRWENLPPMPPATVSTVGKLHGTLGASWVDMTPTTPTTGILIGETLGTFDPSALTWQAVTAGAWLETATYLALASTTAGQATLQKLNIPAFEIGSADFSGSSPVSADSLSVNMTGVKYLAPTAGGRPVIWATGNVNGTYTGNPVSVGNVTLTGSSPTVSGLSPAIAMQSFAGGKWGGAVTTNTAGTVGGHTAIYMNGIAAGSYNGTGSGSFRGTAAGTVK